MWWSLRDQVIRIQNELRKLANKKIAEQSAYFFKTGEGEYGHGDVFLGVRAPVIRELAKVNTDINLLDVKKLIKSKYHEERLLGLIILTGKYKESLDSKEQGRVYKVYLSSFKYINSWDLVDVTCPHIIGKHLMNRDRSVLYKWAKSDHLWTRRIAMVTNWWFVRNGDLKDVFKIAKVLLKDEHDLIHKAVGWMLREAGKKDLKKLEAFLKKHYQTMPRTMLRYSIEKFPEARRKMYLKGLIK